MERDWMRDIRACEGCGEQVYEGARYERGTGNYLGWLCEGCLEFTLREEGPMAKPCAIVSFFHCRRCLLEKPEEEAPKDWARINVGFTQEGHIQVWCARHDINITTLAPQGPVTQQ
jgi:hypothetical protein